MQVQQGVRPAEEQRCGAESRCEVHGQPLPGTEHASSADTYQEAQRSGNSHA